MPRESYIFIIFPLSLAKSTMKWAFTNWVWLIPEKWVLSSNREASPLPDLHMLPQSITDPRDNWFSIPESKQILLKLLCNDILYLSGTLDIL